MIERARTKDPFTELSAQMGSLRVNCLRSPLASSCFTKILQTTMTEDADADDYYGTADASQQHEVDEYTSAKKLVQRAADREALLINLKAPKTAQNQQLSSSSDVLSTTTTQLEEPTSPHCPSNQTTSPDHAGPAPTAQSTSRPFTNSTPRPMTFSWPFRNRLLGLNTYTNIN